MISSRREAARVRSTNDVILRLAKGRAGQKAMVRRECDRYHSELTRDVLL